MSHSPGPAQDKMTAQKKLSLTTLVFLRQEQHVLLARKERGFGKGKLMGVGGKVQDQESLRRCAIRESAEEIHVLPQQLDHVATLDFFTPDWNLQVWVFLCLHWEGQPRASDEMTPFWFHQNALPLDEMWADSPYWLPEILTGTKLHGSFCYNQNFKIDHYQLFYGRAMIQGGEPGSALAMVRH